MEGGTLMRKTDRKERTGRFSDGQASADLPPDEPRGRFSSGQEMFSETSEHTRVGSFGDGQGTGQANDETTTRIRVDHGFPKMTFRSAFARRKEVTSRASEQGLIEAANRSVFHDRGFTLTWDTATGDLWLTPSPDPDGWRYEEDTA
jgi:hypothetical protein